LVSSEFSKIGDEFSDGLLAGAAQRSGRKEGNNRMITAENEDQRASFLSRALRAPSKNKGKNRVI
jgi:hypothetical protein